MVSVEAVADVDETGGVDVRETRCVDEEETGGADVEEAGVVDVEDVADVEETGGADVEETGGADVGEASPSQLCLSSPMVLNIVVLWLPSPRFSPSHLNITSIVINHGNSGNVLMVHKCIWLIWTGFSAAE